MDDTLMCNLKKCRKVLSSGQVWITSCSHLFCPSDGEQYLVKEQKCPACNHVLSGKLDIVRMDLNPSEAYKSMVLCGLHPDIVMDICSRAITFWMFQRRQDYLLKEHDLEKISDKYVKMEKYCNKMVSSYQLEAKALDAELSKTKFDLDSSKKRCEELNELLREKTKQLQKIQSSYSAHRHSSLQRKMSASTHGSPKITHKQRLDSDFTGRQEFSSFDIPIGISRQASPPQRDNNSFEAAFCYSANSIQSSPFVQPSSRNEEGFPRSLFS